MKIENNKIILRDLTESDIEDIIYWNTVETEWMNWDAPWLNKVDDQFDWNEYRQNKRKLISDSKNDKQLRTRFEVCINNEEQTHIGCITSYRINEQYKIDDNGKHLAIGMDIYEPIHRHYGYGSSAYLLFIEYLKKYGYKQIYTQTWSGNLPLIKMVEKMGFKLCNRYKKIRSVRGELYDGLTFVLK